jgi:translation initiation factor IF-3
VDPDGVQLGIKPLPEALAIAKELDLDLVEVAPMANPPVCRILDFDTKTRQVAKFLGEGHKVKITIMFRGREVYHPEHGKRILDRIAEQMEGVAKVEAEPKLDNRNMIMVLAPDKRARQAAQSRATNQQRSDKSGASATPEAGAEAAAGNGAGEAANPQGNGRAPAGEGSGDSGVAASTEEG